MHEQDHNAEHRFVAGDFKNFLSNEKKNWRNSKIKISSIRFIQEMQYKGSRMELDWRSDAGRKSDDRAERFCSDRFRLLAEDGKFVGQTKR